MTYILSIFLFILFTFLFTLLFIMNRLLEKQQKIQERKLLFERFSHIISIFDQAKEISYDKVYRENLLAENTSGYKTNDNEIQEFGQIYVKLVLNCCGESITRDLIDLFGSLDSLCMFLMHGFINKAIDTEATILSKITNDDAEPMDIKDLLLDKTI